MIINKVLYMQHLTFIIVITRAYCSFVYSLSHACLVLDLLYKKRVHFCTLLIIFLEDFNNVFFIPYEGNAHKVYSLFKGISIKLIFKSEH